MSGMQRHPDLEAALRRSFGSADLPAAPRALAEALERVPDAPVATPARAIGRGGRRTTIGLLGLAAVLLVGGGLALSGGSVVPGPAPSAGSIGTTITYRVVWPDAAAATAEGLAAEAAAIKARIDATGAVGLTVATGGPDTLIVTVPVGLDVDPVRQLIGATGRAAFVPLGQDALNAGDPVDRAQYPALFGNEGLADAAVGTNGQTGNRLINLTLAPAAARAFADYTAAHVGQYFAIVLDGRVVTAPVIKSAIPDGEVQIEQSGTVGGWDADVASQFVTLLKTPLPAPLVEISLEPGPTVTPGPSTPDRSGLAEPATASASHLGAPTTSFACEGTPGYTTVVVHLDPSQPEPVWAIATTDDGCR